MRIRGFASVPGRPFQVPEVVLVQEGVVNVGSTSFLFFGPRHFTNPFYGLLEYTSPFPVVHTTQPALAGTTASGLPFAGGFLMDVFQLSLRSL